LALWAATVGGGCSGVNMSVPVSPMMFMQTAPPADAPARGVELVLACPEAFPPRP